MNIVRLILLTSILACFGCSPGPGMIDRVATPADRAVAVEAIIALRSGDIARLSALMVPEVESSITEWAPPLRRSIPADTKVQITLAGAWFVRNLRTGEDRITLDHQVRGSRGQAVVRIGLTHRKGETRVAQFQAARLARPMEVTNAFQFANKGWTHFAFLIAPVLTIGLIIASLVTLARSPAIRWRWAWGLGSLFGLCLFSINWTTGAVSLVPLHVQALGAAAIRTGPVGPWIISWSVPLVALIVLWRHARSRA